MLTIYHNPRCRKSREALEYLESKGLTITVVRYLENPLTSSQIQLLLNKLGKVASEIVRKQETIWKKDYKGKSLTEEELLNALVKHPKLIERPIIEAKSTAVVGRPLENLIAFLE